MAGLTGRGVRARSHRGGISKEVTSEQHSVLNAECAVKRQCQNSWVQILALPPIGHGIMNK